MIGACRAGRAARAASADAVAEEFGGGAAGALGGGVGDGVEDEGFDGGGAGGDGGVLSALRAESAEVGEGALCFGVVEEVDEGAEGEVVALGERGEGEGEHEVIVEEVVRGVGRGVHAGMVPRGWRGSTGIGGGP